MINDSSPTKIQVKYISQSEGEKSTYSWIQLCFEDIIIHYGNLNQPAWWDGTFHFFHTRSTNPMFGALWHQRIVPTLFVSITSSKIADWWPLSPNKSNQKTSTKKQQNNLFFENKSIPKVVFDFVQLFFHAFILRKDLYKTVWEIKQRRVLDLAADRGKYIDQSQSLRLGPICDWIFLGVSFGGMKVCLGGGFKYFSFFTPLWGRFSFWLIFFKGVETTNQMQMKCNEIFFGEIFFWK